MLSEHVVQEAGRLTRVVELKVRERWSGGLVASFVVGSHAYGLSTPQSDVDVRCVHWVHPVPHLLGLNPIAPASPKATIELMGMTEVEGKEEEVDVASHEVGKFVSLALRGNPNILEMLFIPDECVVETSAVFQEFRKHRRSILSKQALLSSYIGYATAQLVRMSGRVLRDLGVGGFPKGESSFSQKLAFLHEAIGNATPEYDTKNAMHVERLLIAATNALKTGELMVSMEEHVPYLQSVRRGELSFRELVGKLSVHIGELNEAEKMEVCPLPNEPNKELITSILCDFRLSCLGR